MRSKFQSGSGASCAIRVTCLETRIGRAAASSLRKAGYHLAMDSPGSVTDEMIARGRSLSRSPDPWKEHALYREWLRVWLESRTNDVLFLVNEAAIHAADSVRRAGGDQGRFILPDSRSLEVTLSKFKTMQLARRIGLEIPRTSFIRPGGSCRISQDVAAGFTFPLILKWDNSESPDGRRYEKGALKVVESHDDFRACLAELAPLNCGVIAQEIVPGQGVGAFFLRHNGRIVLRFAHRRLHEVPWTGGVSAYCESSDDAEVLAAGERLLEELDYEGVAMVEFRKEPGRPPVLLEINGRLWGSVGLALAAGPDFPLAMVDCHVHGRTGVRQVDLSRTVRWHDPGLQMDYLRSLWTKAPGPTDGPAPLWTGTLGVLRCFLDPRVKSDWWEWGRPITTLKRYARFWRREMAWLKKQWLQRLKSEGAHPLVAAAVERTVEWAKRTPRPERILFLCYGNILRSPYSEKRWNSWRKEDPELPPAYSVGFHDNACRETPDRFQSAAGHRGVDLSTHRSRRVVAADVAEASVIFAMDLRNLGDMEREFPEALGKTLLLGALGGGEDAEIPDPYGQPIGAGGAAYRRIDLCLERMRNLLGSSA